MKKNTYLYGEIHKDGRVVIVRQTPHGLVDHDHSPTKRSLKRIKRYAKRKCSRRDNGVLSFAEYAI